MYASKLYFKKGVLKWGKNLISKIFPSITAKQFPRKIRPAIINIGKDTVLDDLPDPPDQGFDEWLFDYLEKDWNPTFKEIGETGTLLGYLSGYLTGELKLPLETVTEMGIQDYDKALKYKLGFGIDEVFEKGKIVSKKEVSRLAAEYAKEHGAEWLAIYKRDDQGEIIYSEDGQPVRGGKPYEYLTQMWRDMIVTAIQEGKTLEQMQSDFAYPDLLDLVENGTISSETYLELLNGKESELLQLRLNRNFRRFAWTEASMAFNAGRIRAMSELGIDYGVFRKGQRVM
ncbi:hypothetical protein EHQ23_19605 [Leptospira bourretii]|uniref:Uncharacterized protein n=2 Tax=Leptospira bourretii TaxID=2484962 RepID=A0A4R9IQY0_9LEPT|nr:hypothetical protein [Leptospira levettii]TGK79278.1 hypothetical protein EHQ23_19605 [Leptospira bourretii]TGK94394.1 hypothetical protein EHQ26_03315 [Leptospira bourretii]TGL16851.1 hypothetical protein EHQ42_10720 [Leptospira levettii]TGL38886.1 hypothetical protein EHQ45_04715 [Leptospira bourretii]